MRVFPWAESYIEDAATKRVSAYLRGKLFCDQVSNYDPPDNGVHLCGQTDDGQQPTTVAEYPMRRNSVERYFEAAREVAECEKGAHDFIVDRCIDGLIDIDFYSNRQLWPRAIAAWNEIERAALATSNESPDTQPD